MSVDRDRLLSPYLYEAVWRLAIHGPLTAGEIADSHNARANSYSRWTAHGTANRMRTLVRRGLLERGEDRIYRLTARGVAWMEVR